MKCFVVSIIIFNFASESSALLNRRTSERRAELAPAIPSEEEEEPKAQQPMSGQDTYIMTKAYLALWF